MLYRQKNGNPVYVAIPHQAAGAVLAIPPMSEMYFFWSGNGRPETAGRGWRRSIEHVYTTADLKRNGKKLRAHTHRVRSPRPFSGSRAKGQGRESHGGREGKPDERRLCSGCGGRGRVP